MRYDVQILLALCSSARKKIGGRMTWTDFITILNVLVPGASAFGGAYAAFRFENARERRKETDEQYRALRFAHFVVLSQYQVLITLRDRYLQHMQNPDRDWMHLHPVLLSFAAPSLKVSELGFVLEGADPDLLNRLLVGQQLYETVRNLLTTRNQVFAGLQRRAAELEAQGVHVPDNEEAFQSMFGKDLVTQVKDLTMGAVEAHRRATALLEENLRGISTYISAQFPNRRAPQFDLIPQETRR
jgi:hypothetical protein